MAGWSWLKRVNNRQDKKEHFSALKKKTPVWSKNVMNDIPKPKHLKSGGSKIFHVKKHLPQSLPREERYFCSEYIV